jgi:aldehyde dehydrogenase
MSNVAQRPDFKAKYDNYIGGKFVAPIKGAYFDVYSPVDGKVFTQAAHSTKEDLELTVDNAYEAFQTWEKHPQQSVVIY